MSRGSEFDDVPYDSGSEGPPPQKPGWSTGAKVALILGICAVVLMLICCGVGGYFINKVQKSVKTDPAEIAAIRGQMISSINLPETYRPQMGMDLAIAGQGMRMAVYGNTAEPGAGGTMLMLMQMTIAADEAQMRRELQKSMGNQQQINIESSETRTLTIEGEMVDFKFAKGTTDKGDAMRQVTGVLAGKQGTLMLMLIVPEADWDEEEVVGILESIKK